MFKAQFNPKSADAGGITNTHLTLTTTGLPPGLKCSGTAQLKPSVNPPKGTYTPPKGTYTIKAGQLRADFGLERDLKIRQSFNLLQLVRPEGTKDWPGAELTVSPDLPVDPVIPKEMELLPGAESSVEVAPEIRFHAKEPPASGILQLCDVRFLDRTTLAPAALELVGQSNFELEENGFKLTFKVTRPKPSEAREGVDVFPRLCSGDNSWVYKGHLPKIEPLIEQGLEVQASPKDAKADELILTLPAGTARAVAQSVKAYTGLTDIPGIKGLPENGVIPFKLNNNRKYDARLAVGCSSGESSLVPIVLIATDSGPLHMFKSKEGVRICERPSGIDRIISLMKNFILSFRWLIGGVLIIVLGILAFVGRRKIRSWFRRSDTSSSTTVPPRQEAPAPVLVRDPFPRSLPKEWETGLTQVFQSQLDPIHDTLNSINVNLRRLLDYQSNNRNNVALPASEENAQVEPPSLHKSLQPELDGTLVSLINRWWADGADRDRLGSLARQDTSVKSYRSLNVQDSLRSSTNRTFQFQPLPGGPIEWLGRAQQGDLFLVPGEPRLFQTGDSLKFLGVLFEGLGSNLSNVRFRRIVKACRLKKEPGSPDRYRVVDRGIIELEGRTQAEAPILGAQPAQPRQDLYEIIRRAIGEAMPGGLQAQIQDLARQVRLLTESVPRQPTQASSPDPNVTTTLNAVRQEMSALSQRMNTIERVAQVVETLDGSLTRIEVALRNLPSQAPPLVTPSAPPAERPPKGGTKKSSQIEDSWMEKLRRGMREEIPAVVGPLPPQSPAPLAQPSAPEQLWAKLEKWWPKALNSRIGGDYFDGEPSIAYLRDLDELKKTLTGAIRDRGWQVDVVHVKVPDNAPTGEPILQIHKPNSIEGQRVVCSCVPNSSFSDALLFQFAIRVQGDGGQDIAVLPAPGLRLVGSTEGYARLVGEELSGGVTTLAEVTRPAILSWSGSDDLFTIVLPMQARFR